jgi:hypothetical protein
MSIFLLNANVPMDIRQHPASPVPVNSNGENSSPFPVYGQSVATVFPLAF